MTIQDAIKLNSYIRCESENETNQLMEYCCEHHIDWNGGRRATTPPNYFTPHKGYHDYIITASASTGEIALFHTEIDSVDHQVILFKDLDGYRAFSKECNSDLLMSIYK